jgi:predicted lipid-binding transport protein (Tim44 family)
MNGSVDIYTIIFLALAVVIFLRLRSVLGRRTGSERPPFDPFARRDATRPPPAEKVISLPQRPGTAADTTTIQPGPQTSVDVERRIKAVAPGGGPLADSLKRLMASDPGFDPQKFLEGGRTAYEMVVTAFAEGDRRQLRQLLSREVFDGFVAAISQRESRQEKIDFKFVGIEKAEITDATVRNGTEQVTVRFVSQLISATRDKDGKVIDGDETKVSDVTDIWTFARDVGSRDPNWRLVATESVD